jgi:hypothetical protein
MTSYNLDFFLEHFEDVCAEDFEGFTQQHFDRIGNMFFAPIKPENPKGAVRLARTKSAKSSTQETLCDCPAPSASRAWFRRNCLTQGKA